MSISKSTLAKLAVVVLVWFLLALALALVILIPPAVSTVLGWRSLTAGNIERPPTGGPVRTSTSPL